MGSDLSVKDKKDEEICLTQSSLLGFLVKNTGRGLAGRFNSMSTGQPLGVGGSHWDLSHTAVWLQQAHFLCSGALWLWVGLEMFKGNVRSWFITPRCQNIVASSIPREMLSVTYFPVFYIASKCIYTLKFFWDIWLQPTGCMVSFSVYWSEGPVTTILGCFHTMHNCFGPCQASPLLALTLVTSVCGSMRQVGLHTAKTHKDEETTCVIS